MEQNIITPTNEERPQEQPGDSKITVDLEAATKLNTRKRKFIIILVVILVILGGLFAIAYRFKGLVLAAMVDGKPISRFKVIDQLERQGGKQTLDVLVNKQLIANEAKAKNISVSGSEIDEVIKKYEDTYSGEGDGMTLDQLLEEQGLTREDLREEITLQKQVEKLVADKIQVSDEEVQAFITENKVAVAKETEEETKSQVREQLKQDKVEEASSQLLSDLREKAKVRTFVDYAK